MSTPGDGPDITDRGLTPAPSQDGPSGTHLALSLINGQRTVESHDLLAGQPSVLIRHLGEIYRLQTTRQGKLILTK